MHHHNIILLLQICPANTSLSTILSLKAKEILGDEIVVNGLNVSADSFYSSQGLIYRTQTASVRVLTS
jgi:hypothetical protein